VDGLRREAAAFVAEMDAAHQAMAAEQQEHLVAERTRLAGDVDALRGTFQAELGAIRTDQRDARRVWNSLALLLRGRKARQPGAPPPVTAAPRPPAPAEEPAPAAIPVQKAAADDLTVIRGIGAAMAERLNRAGVHSFVQLAHSTPDDLRQLLGDVGRLAKVEAWIEQAQALSGSM
jgi:predicted flap endonuclease-1-like 5' DNA nuclease